MEQFIPWYCHPELRPEGWEDLYKEYVSMRENRSTAVVLEMLKEIAFLETRLFITAECVKVLAQVYSPEIVQELKEMGHKGKFDPAHPDEYARDLKAVTSASKRMIFSLNRKRADLQNMQERQGGKGITEKTFEEWNVDLERFMHREINFESTSVAKWCVMMNKMEAWLEVKNSEANNLIKEDDDGSRR